MARLLGRYIVLVCAVLVLNFALPRLLPGDPLGDAPVDSMNAAVSTLTPAQRAALRASYHLDQPIGRQFVAYLRNLSRGDLGWSISKSAPVSQLIVERLPWTLALVLTSLLIATAGGVLLGLLSGWRGGWTDRMILGLSSGLAAIPEFLVAMALLLLLAVVLRWFPLQGGRSPFSGHSSGPSGLSDAAVDVARHLVLPALTLVLATTASFVLLVRGSTRAVLTAPYLTTARAKGLTEGTIAIRHALPNALLPVLTMFALRLGELFGGAIVVERVFAVPGLGLFAFDAIQARDYPVLQAVFLLASLGVLTGNLTADLAYRWLETRHAS